MTGPFDADTDVLSRSMNEHARQVPPLPAGPILQQGRRIRRRQRTIAGGGLVFSAVLAAGIATSVMAYVNNDRAIVLPVSGAPTSGPVQSKAASAADRFRFDAEFMKQETTLVTAITGRTTVPSSGVSVPVRLNLVRNPRSNHLPDGVTTSKDPVYVEEQIAGVPIWIADNVTRGSRRAVWVYKNQQFSLQADRGLGDERDDVSKADLRALISLAIARS
jgi:hypothetical protein